VLFVRQSFTDMNMILDDGGDAVATVRRRAYLEAGEDLLSSRGPKRKSHRWAQILTYARPPLSPRPSADIQGVSEETTTGVHHRG
jgi:S-adenosylhomocysteine hydrolase